MAEIILGGSFVSLLRCYSYLHVLNVLQYTSGRQARNALYWRKTPDPKTERGLKEKGKL